MSSITNGGQLRVDINYELQMTNYEAPQHSLPTSYFQSYL